MSPEDRIILDLSAKHVRALAPAAAICAFGSRARGSADAESDLDLCVVLPNVTRELRVAIYAIAWDIGFDQGRMLAPILLSEEDFERAPLSASTLVAISVAKESPRDGSREDSGAGPLSPGAGARGDGRSRTEFGERSQALRGEPGLLHDVLLRARAAGGSPNGNVAAQRRHCTIRSVVCEAGVVAKTMVTLASRGLLAPAVCGLRRKADTTEGGKASPRSPSRSTAVPRL